MRLASVERRFVALRVELEVRRRLTVDLHGSFDLGPGLQPECVIAAQVAAMRERESCFADREEDELFFLRRQHETAVNRSVRSDVILTVENLAVHDVQVITGRDEVDPRIWGWRALGGVHRSRDRLCPGQPEREFMNAMIGQEQAGVFGEKSFCRDAHHVLVGWLRERVLEGTGPLGCVPVRAPSALPEETIVGTPYRAEQERELGDGLPGLAIDHGALNRGWRRQNDLAR